MKKNFKMAGLIALLLMALALAMAGCGDDEGYDPETGGGTAGGSESDDLLSKLDGWWTRPDDYESEGFSLVDNFKIDADAGTWTIYNNYGVADSTFDCHAGGDTLILEMDGLGEAAFAYDGYGLRDPESGRLHFIPSDPIEAADAADFEGRWYLGGVVGGDYYEIEGNNYLYYDRYDPDEPRNTGVWSLSDITRVFEDADSITEKVIEFEVADDIFGGKDFAFDEDEVAFFDSFGKVFYLHEDAIGTAQGDTLTAIFTLAFNDWEGPEWGDPFLTFGYYDKKFSYTEYVDGTGKRSPQGTWSVSGTTVTLEFDSGETEEFEFDEDSFYLEYYGMTFANDTW